MEKEKIIFIANILIFFALALIFSLYNMCLPLMDHDSQHIFNHTCMNALAFEYTRIPPFILSKMYSYTLPHLFNMHPTDFRSDYFVCIIVSFFYVLFSLLISKSFYLTFEKTKKYVERKESVILLPLIFVCASFYLFDTTLAKQPIFLGIKDASVFFEYVFGYILYFPFFTKLFDIIINKSIFSKKEILIYSVIGLLLGLWSEFVNIPAFLTSLLILFGIICFSRETIKNKSLWVLITSFYVGLFIFYVVSGNFNLTNFGTIENFNILYQNINNFSLSNEFYKIYFETYFADFKILWIILITSTILTKALCRFVSEDKRHNINKTILLSYTLIFGYLLCAYFSIFIDKTLRLGQYIFQMFSFSYDGYLIFIFAICFIAGIFYNYSDKIFKIILTCLIIIFTVYAYNIFIPVYINAIQKTKIQKLALYNLEKKFILYSVFGERAILGKQDLTWDFNAYAKAKVIHLGFRYISYIYNHNLIGIIMDKDYAEEEMKKREKAIGHSQDEYNIFHVIKYTPIKKYDNINLSFEEINKREKQNGKNDIYSKARAYLYLQQKNYDKALNLYEEYLEKNPFDIDSQIQIAKIYEIQQNFKAAENIYQGLIKTYPDNMYIMMNLSCLFYSQEKYQDALNINKKILKLLQQNEEKYIDLIPCLYYENAVLYKKLNQKQLSEEWYKKIKISDNLYWIGFLYPFDSIDFEKFYENNNEYKFVTSDILKTL